MTLPLNHLAGRRQLRLRVCGALNLRAGRVLSVQPKGCAATASHQSACGYSVVWLHGLLRAAPRDPGRRFALVDY